MNDTFEFEKAHLEATLGEIEALLDKSRDEVLHAYDELMYARSADPDSLDVREMSYQNAQNAVMRLTKALNRPYFTRVDFIESAGENISCYIGKYGINDLKTLKTIVVDWRAPIANLYYCGQIGQVSYEAPDGKIEGELTLKRQLDIKGGKLLGVFDMDIASQDAYLQSALSRVSGDRLKDIVNTIQSEQNLIIRMPLKYDLVVQGVAGSGKTMVALHRIAYLLYTYADRLRAERMLIIAPNPLFLNYISSVLPDLGVENVKQSTFELFFLKLLGDSYSVKPLADRLSALMALKPNERSKLNSVSVLKGSLRFKAALDKFLADYAKSLCPADDIKFGPVSLWKTDEVKKFLLIDEAPLPLRQRLEQFERQLLKRTRAAADDICRWYKSEALKRADKLRAQIEDSSELKLRIDALYSSRDKRIQETLEQVNLFVKGCMAAFPSVKPMDIYAVFMQALNTGEYGSEFIPLAEHTLAYLNGRGDIETEDIAPLVIITKFAERLEKPVFRHIVIDEAQDLSPVQLWAFKCVMSEATFTLVGDIMQGISASRGIASWDELNGMLKTEGCLSLSTSYRSTREIMNEALKAVRKYASNVPVSSIRSGEPCAYISVADESERIEAICNLVDKARKRSYNMIAIMEKDSLRALNLLKRLPESMGAKLLKCDESSFTQGVYVANAYEAKGLEFDAVIIADASDKIYLDDEHDAKLMYVAITRALHSLSVVYTGSLTQLLS